MKIQEIFENDVKRDIPPVVYFHEKDPARLKDEVREYIITGGYQKDDPRHARVPDGIHEQMKHVLRGIREALDRGADLPGCWISGFFGSGKSSFAKLLGLALDGVPLPDGTLLSDALLARDDSPLSGDLRAAWTELRDKIDPIAVVFDIGSVSRDDEHIHSAARRQLQERLGYCPTSDFVSDYELRLERDGKWDEFLECAQRVLKRPWSEAMHDFLAEDHFSLVMHEMNRDLYTEPDAWLDKRVGVGSVVGASVDEVVRDIEAMLRFRAAGKTLFFVVDEVSQYIFQSHPRQLALQSLVEHLGQRLKGKVWLLATGQQKLEEDMEGGSLGKVKDRFPPRLRVHLAATNIRDVVHKRLLEKAPEHEEALRKLFHAHRPDLKLHGYAPSPITELDFLETYPMMPDHVDLLMQITTSLRVRSSRMKGDDHAIRGLLQLLGEIFREQDLGEQPLGHLLTIEHIYDAQYTALDADVQNTMARLRSHPELGQDETALRAAKAVALLELVQETKATTADLVARCLYHRLGAGNQVDAYRDSLERLREASFVSLSEKQGYRIQSSIGQEWTNERDSQPVTSQALSDVVIEKLKDLLGRADRPRFKGRSFPLAATFSDGRAYRDHRLLNPSDLAVMAVDFQYLPRQEDRRADRWVKESDSEQRRLSVVWVAGPPSTLEQRLKDLVRSRQMVGRYASRVQSLPEAKRRLLYDEQTRQDTLETDVRDLIAEVFVEGQLYFQGRDLKKDRHPATFGGLLQGTAEEILPSLYQNYVDVAVTETEMKQLLEPRLSGVSNKFLGDGLGLLEIEGGRYTASCTGEVPARVAAFIEQETGVSGSVLLGHFGGPPCGYPPDVARACVLGLLRGGKVRIKPESGREITSVQDPGVQDLFLKDRDFKRAEIYKGGGGAVSPRDRVAISKFFEESLHVEVERENEAIADAVKTCFPREAERLRELESRLARLPQRPVLTGALEKLQKTLESCLRPHHVEERVQAVKDHLDSLRDGLQQLGVLLADITEDGIRQVREAQDVRAVHLEQLRALDGKAPELQQAEEELAKQLGSDRPWRDVASLAPTLAEIKKRYAQVRLDLIQRSETDADQLRERLKLRTAFDRLTPEQVEHVMRPFREALGTLDPNAVHPPLVMLRDTVSMALQKADSKANHELDRILVDVDRIQVVPVPTQLQGREFSSPTELDALLAELRARLLLKLDGGKVRIRLE